MSYYTKFPPLFAQRVFSPAYLPNLRLWLDAADAATIVHSLGSVSQWSDKSGNGNNATQGTGANQPITGTRTINGLNALDFDGTNSRFGLPSGLFSVPNGSNTVFVVAASDVNSGVQRAFSGGVGGASRWGVFFNGTNEYGVINNSVLTSATTTVTLNTNAHIVGLNRDGSNITPLYDGALATQALAASVTINGLNIGSVGGGTATPWNGRISEIIVYSRSLSNSETNQVGNYLKNKWGATWTNI